jgi:hypothetical protein
MSETEQYRRKPMREKSKYAGLTVKIKENVGEGWNHQKLAGMDFLVEDWCENLLGCSWMDAPGNGAVLEYYVRTSHHGEANHVPDYSVDVLGGKVEGYSHLFHINELELENVKTEKR